MLVRGWQRTAGTALQEAMYGTIWPVHTQLLAEVVDALNIANWQRGGRKNSPKPKRIPRPWEKKRAQTLGSDPIPISQFDDWWDAQEPHAA